MAGLVGIAQFKQAIPDHFADVHSSQSFLFAIKEQREVAQAQKSVLAQGKDGGPDNGPGSATRLTNRPGQFNQGGILNWVQPKVVPSDGSFP